jgi:hypothetical protein
MMPRDCGARQLPVPGGASVLRDRIFFDRGQLNECTHSILVWPRIDLVTKLEPPPLEDGLKTIPATSLPRMREVL